MKKNEEHKVKMAKLELFVCGWLYKKDLAKLKNIAHYNSLKFGIFHHSSRCDTLEKFITNWIWKVFQYSKDLSTDFWVWDPVDRGVYDNLYFKY